MMKQFIGAFFTKEATLVVAEIIIVALVLVLWFSRKRLDHYFLLLLALFGLNCWMVSQRMTLETLGLIDPLGPGQRYFFYPYILFGWVLIWIAYISNAAAVRGVIALALVWAVVGHAGTKLSRRSDVFSWREHIQACAQSDTYDLPIHYDGNGKDIWSINLTGAECRSMIETSWIR